MEKKIRTSKDDNIYKKNPDGTFSPIGIAFDRDYLFDGVWYVRHHDHAIGFTSGKYLEGIFEIPRDEKLSISQLCDLTDILDRVMDSNEYRDMMGSNMSQYEFVGRIIAIVQKIASEEKEDRT